MQQSLSPRKRAVTMRDVAKLANVSQSTVSRVLNGTEDGIPIGEETRQRVMEAVETLGYYPNLYAGSLRGQKTFMLAMMVADIANPFYHPMVRAVQDVAHTHRYDVMIANTDHTRDGEMAFVEAVIRRPVDGIILVPYHLTETDIERLLVRTGGAVATLGQHVHHPQVDTVFGDDERAVLDAVTWLICEQGHRRIGFIKGHPNHMASDERLFGYRRALDRAGISFEPSLVADGLFDFDSGTEAARHFLSMAKPPTAIFASNDDMAAGVLAVAHDRGIAVPDQLSVAGFDDTTLARTVWPPLTTIRQPMFELADTAAQLLLGGGDIAHKRLPHELIERRSTAPCPAKMHRN